MGAHLQVGQTQPPEQAEALGRGPLLRPVQQVQAGPVGVRRPGGTYLIKFSWTKIVRHQLVNGRASPDDPALADYWAARRRKGPPLPLANGTMRLMQAQHGRCPVCGDLLLPAESLPASPREWEHWLRTTRKTISTTIAPVGGPSDGSHRRLTHVSCQRRHHVRGSPPQRF